MVAPTEMVNVEYFVQHVQKLLRAFIKCRNRTDPGGIHQSEEDWWDDLTKDQGFVCADCRNVFLQPPRCTTCGAEKLYDATVRQQAADIDRLRQDLARYENAHKVLVAENKRLNEGENEMTKYNCDTCKDTKVVEETLGGAPRSNPKAPCPDCADVPAPKFDPEKFLEEKGSLQFREFMEANVQRMQRWHGEDDGFTLSDWSNAMAGEAGEACNVVKKIRRLDLKIRTHRSGKSRDAYLQDLGEELADVLHYVFLTANAAGLDLEKFVIEKFNAVSEAEGFPERL